MINYQRNFYFLLLMAVLASVALGWYAYNQHQTIISKSNQIQALTDTVVLYKTKNGASGASKLIFAGSKDDVLTILKAENKKAYNIVKSTKDIHTYTDFSTVTKIDTIVKADTVYLVKDSTGKLDYTLAKDIVEPRGYYNAKIDVKNDSVGLKVNMTDKYHVVTKEKSNGIFKPKSYVMTVENENPYVTITGMQAFEITQKKPRLGLKIGGAVAIGLGAFLLLHR